MCTNVIMIWIYIKVSNSPFKGYEGLGGGHAVKKLQIVLSHKSLSYKSLSYNRYFFSSVVYDLDDIQFFYYKKIKCFKFYLVFFTL